MHDNRWEGEKDEDKEKEDKAKREKPKNNRKEEEEEGVKAVDEVKPPTTAKVAKSNLIVIEKFHFVKLLVTNSSLWTF